MQKNPSPVPITPERTYTANSFTIEFIDDWQDNTIYTLTGPVTNGIQHNIIINIDCEVRFDALLEFAEWRIKGMIGELKEIANQY